MIKNLPNWLIPKTKKMTHIKIIKSANFDKKEKGKLIIDTENTYLSLRFFIKHTIILLRILLTLLLIHGVYTETGIFTAIAMLLIFITIEAIILKIKI